MLRGRSGRWWHSGRMLSLAQAAMSTNPVGPPHRGILRVMQAACLSRKKSLAACGSVRHLRKDFLAACGRVRHLRTNLLLGWQRLLGLRKDFLVRWGRLLGLRKDSLVRWGRLPGLRKDFRVGSRSLRREAGDFDLSPPMWIAGIANWLLPTAMRRLIHPFLRTAS